MKSGIYLIKNIINNKVYIGSAVNISNRWREHKKYLKKGKHHSKHLQNAWNINGQLNFKFEIIEEISNPLHLLSYEQVYLDYYKSYERERGYNICKIAGSPIGLRRSEETKQKMSKANRNCKKYKYYSFNKDKKKYRVKIWGKDIGYYNTEEEAKQAVIINLEKLRTETIVSQ